MIDIAPVVSEQLPFNDLAAEGTPGGNVILEALPVVASLFVLNVLPLDGFVAEVASRLNVPPVTDYVVNLVLKTDELPFSDGSSAVCTAHQRLNNTDRFEIKGSVRLAGVRSIVLSECTMVMILFLQEQDILQILPPHPHQEAYQPSCDHTHLSRTFPLESIRKPDRDSGRHAQNQLQSSYVR